MDTEKLLLAEIKKAKISRYAISKYTGVDSTALCRFANGERGLSMKNADRLLRFFGYSWAKTTGMPKLPPAVKRGRPKKKESEV